MNIILTRPFLIAARRPLYKSRKFSLATNESIVKTQTGVFRLISESTPVEYLQKFIVSIHDTTGLPWWATIVCTTIFLRSTVTVPLAFYQHYILAKVRNIQLELADIGKELKKEVDVAVQLYKWDERTAKIHYTRSIKKQWSSLVVRDNCHPVKASLLIWFQIPLWVCFSGALRNLAYKLPESSPNAYAVFYDLSNSDFGWITNLAQADPLFILPIAFGLINLSIIEIQVLSRTSEPTRFQRYLMNFFRCFALIMVPITASVPSCVALYWTTSSAFGIFQNFLLLSPRMKRLCRIPKTASDVDKPYLNILKNVRKRYSLLKT